MQRQVRNCGKAGCLGACWHNSWLDPLCGQPDWTREQRHTERTVARLQGSLGKQSARLQSRTVQHETNSNDFGVFGTN